MSSSTHDKTPAYYVPESSRLPIAMAFTLFLLAWGGAGWLQQVAGIQENTSGVWIFSLGMILFAATLTIWFTKTSREHMAGLNSEQLQDSYRQCMKWFIVSEAMFFAAFFGGLFYVRFFELQWMAGEGAKAATGMLYEGFEYTWPLLVNPNPEAVPGPQEAMHWTIPLINTTLLITSSVTLTFAHHALRKEHRSGLKNWLLATIVLAVIFLGFQAYEYYEAYAHLGLTLDSGIYGSTFFILTGFHGIHVIMGTIILIALYFRVLKGHFTGPDHFGFEAGAWYWHFVDVIWVLLFFVVYIF
ncbi:MAG: cytochrome c oxidase subunit 3 [Natronospirillum sp.]|uniref:cytochrome c oxidase subunit 3 n=1 Tax=Natronospirillum sp. TaxID=2812955 RepID=UPI0025F8759F|nr:cytochrome c oxidase subunit 3 [Natronospirillum sp.]MCH8551729.1 cytochrome c oxidase subunit 3 [Natronospirillum sp.]